MNTLSTANGPSLKQAARETEIQSQLALMQGNLSRLRELSHVVTDRLGRVLRPVQAEPCKPPMAIVEPETPLAAELFGHNNSIETITLVLTELLNRVEV